ncbi:MAG: ABC transporter permease [Lachnospiraceae bacterium]|nr:ABC transporter permease [Lachnospiraceae bacterium]
MRAFFYYFNMEWKRMRRLIPGILLVSLVAALAAGILYRNSDSEETTAEPMAVGIVSDEGNLPFLSMGFQLAAQTEDLKNLLTFQDVGEEEGQEMLEAGTLGALVIFQDNYVRNVYYGTEEPIIIRFGSSQSGIASVLVRELTDVVAQYLLESRSAVYAMQDLYTASGLEYGSAPDELSETLLLRIVGRTNAIKTETVNATDGLSASVYYFCAAVVLILLFWGMISGAVLGKDGSTMRMLLRRTLLSLPSQYLAKLLALFAMFLCNYLVLGGLGIAAVRAAGMDIPAAEVIFRGIPGLIPTAALAILVFELSGDGIGGMLFLFFSTVICAFLSGFFYPLSYFPFWMQRASCILPTRILLEFYESCASGSLAPGAFAGPALMTAILAAVTLLFWRRKRI